MTLSFCLLYVVGNIEKFVTPKMSFHSETFFLLTFIILIKCLARDVNAVQLFPSPFLLSITVRCWTS